MGTVGSYILVAYKGDRLRGLRLEAGAVVRADPPNQPYPGKQARAELKQQGRGQTFQKTPWSQRRCEAGNKEPSVSRGTTHLTLGGVCYVCTSLSVHMCMCVLDICLWAYYVCTCPCLCMCACVYMPMSVHYMCTCPHLCMCVLCVYASMCVHVCVMCVRAQVCACVCYVCTCPCLCMHRRGQRSGAFLSCSPPSS